MGPRRGGRNWIRNRLPPLPESGHEGLLLLVWLWACGQRASVVRAKRQVHSLGAEDAARAGAPHRQGRLSTQRLMRPARVVERDPGRNPGPRLAAIRIA